MSDLYAAALAEIRAIIDRESEVDEIVRQTVDVLHDRLEHYSWVGIYFVEENDLVLGPWRGPAATEHVRIPVGQGVCGAAAASGRTEIVDDVNADRSRYEQVKRFTILPRDFTMDDVELTPTLKLKRRVVLDHFADAVDRLYETER